MHLSIQYLFCNKLLPFRIQILVYHIRHNTLIHVILLTAAQTLQIYRVVSPDIQSFTFFLSSHLCSSVGPPPLALTGAATNNKKTLEEQDNGA